MIGSPAAQGLALASATGFGVSDFVGGIASRQVAALRVLLVSAPVSAVLLGVLATGVGGSVDRAAIILGVLGGISQALGVWWFYAALGSGPISVVSPLAAVIDAGVPVCFGTVVGERPGFVAAAGIVVALMAVVLISREAPSDTPKPDTPEPDTPSSTPSRAPYDHPTPRFTTTVAWLTLASGLALGSNYVFLDRAPSEARLWPLVFARATATVVVVLIAVATRNLKAPSGAPLKLAYTGGILDTAANIAMLLALHLALLSLASVLISLYPVVTVALAIVVLHERVHRWQVIGMALAAVGVVMITAG